MTFSIDVTTHISPNHSARKTPVPTAIVIHTGEGTRASDLSWLKKPQGEKSVSCHYYVCKDGTIYQLVSDSREAWHAGTSEYLGYVGWGDFSIGIETEHKQGQGWPEIQREALKWLCKLLIARYKIRRSMVVAHRWIAPQRKIDPTDWPDTALTAWIEELYKEDWEGIWGTRFPYRETWGIPTAYRDSHRKGVPLGEARTDEFSISGGGVCQAFEHGWITWHPQNGIKVGRWS